MGIVRVFLCCCLVLFSSCAYLKRAFVEDRQWEISCAEKASAQFLSSGDFEKAIDAYRDVYNKYARDRQVQKGISGVGQVIRDRADAAYKREDCTTAGRLSHILLMNAHFKNSRGVPLFDLEEAAARRSDCSDRLTKKGLEYYRKGELRRAIGIWESVLEFDPDNLEVRKAVDTASAQLKNLR